MSDEPILKVSNIESYYGPIMAIRGVSREDLICVTGSFYVVGEALKYLSERK
jgi:folylpolyglutamate synthase/dihydropteroate synthase